MFLSSRMAFSKSAASLLLVFSQSRIFVGPYQDLCGFTARAKEYGARWLWPSSYKEMDDNSGDWNDVLSQTFRETMWTLARIHEVAWSVTFMIVLWDALLIFFNRCMATRNCFAGMYTDEALEIALYTLCSPRGSRDTSRSSLCGCCRTCL